MIGKKSSSESGVKSPTLFFKEKILPLLIGCGLAWLSRVTIEHS